MDPATERASPGNPLGAVVGEERSADPSDSDRTASAHNNNSNNSNSNSTSRLLNLPAELRLQIWQACSSSTRPQPPFIRWAADVGGGLEISTEVDGRFIFASKQVFAEAAPVLAASVQLHITYLGHTPAQPRALPQRSLCGRTESLFFHCADPRSSSGWGDDRPPRQPVPFRRFPRLRTFVVCKPFLVDIIRLRAVVVADDGSSSSSSPMTRERYDALMDAEKLTAWETVGFLSADTLIGLVAWFGRGGWLSRLVDPEDRARAHDDAGDDDDESDDESEFHSTDDDYDDEDLVEVDLEEKKREKRERSEARDLEVTNKMHTILEAELVLHEGESWNPIPIQTLLVTVDTRARKILEIRLLSKEEEADRYEKAREAT